MKDLFSIRDNTIVRWQHGDSVCLAARKMFRLQTADIVRLPGHNVILLKKEQPNNRLTIRRSVPTILFDFYLWLKASILSADNKQPSERRLINA